MVAGGHLIDILDNSVYSSTVKAISVHLLHVIAHRHKLQQLCGDVGNAFVNAFTKEKVYAIAGPEFGKEREGQVVIIVKALYGLATSAERWHSFFADFLRSLGFVPTRYDQDVWIKLADDKKSYEYICTHVDDFMIVAANPHPIMKEIQRNFTVKSIGPPDYYLGNDYKKDKKGRWCIGCKKYLLEALRRVEEMFGAISKESTPLPSNDHPEMDTSDPLKPEEHRKFQMLIGMLNWLVSIGRFDVAYAVSLMARFVACPRQGHLKRAIRIFGYLKKYPNKRIRVDSRDPIRSGSEEAWNEDLSLELHSAYPDAQEELDPDLPKPLVPELAITVLVDSDHAHDKVTRRSITGLLIFLGRTPVYWMSKRQGAIETSTYGAEFMAMKTAVEEVISIRYMLRCLGVKVTAPTNILGDNRSVIINSTEKDSLLKKKHVAISYHKTREAAAAKIVRPLKTHSSDNYADMLTKALGKTPFTKLCNGVLA